MTTSEPTTGEIVFALICCGNCENCSVECYYLKRDCGDVLFDASARIKSQEREIEELKSEAIVNALENAERIAELTARAESAERERDAANERVTDYELSSRGF